MNILPLGSCPTYWCTVSLPSSFRHTAYVNGFDEDCGEERERWNAAPIKIWIVPEGNKYWIRKLGSSDHFFNFEMNDGRNGHLKICGIFLLMAPIITIA